MYFMVLPSIPKGKDKLRLQAPGQVFHGRCHKLPWQWLSVPTTAPVALHVKTEIKLCRKSHEELMTRRARVVAITAGTFQLVGLFDTPRLLVADRCSAWMLQYAAQRPMPSLKARSQAATPKSPTEKK